MALAIRIYVWLIFKTCKIEKNFDSEALDILKNKKQYIIAFWHSRILPFPKFLSTYSNISAVISSHNDAEYLAHILKDYGFELIRGSSRKQSLFAMFGIIKAIKSGKSIAITPDGPKGPRFKIKGNIINLCNKFNIPIIPATYSAYPAIVFNSWDRFILPLPFISKVKIEIGKALLAKDITTSIHLEKLMLKQVKAIDKQTNLKIDY